MTEAQWQAEVDRVAAERDQIREMYAVLKSEFAAQSRSNKLFREIVSQVERERDAAIENIVRISRALDRANARKV